MNKVALNFISKNESHIILRMLSSAKDLVDMIVGVDTGSTDNTIDIIKGFGAKHNIPVFVYSRPFDNFCNSRNYAMEKLKEKALDMGWDATTAWGLTLDCDETLAIASTFDKHTLTGQMYCLRHLAGHSSFAREAFFRLDQPLVWKSPIHEFLFHPGGNANRPVLENIDIIEDPGGASWTGNLEEKYLRYGTMLEAYLNEGNRDYRTLSFVGDSYATAGNFCKDPTRAQQHFQKAHDYFLEAEPMKPDSREAKFLLLKKMGENCKAMQLPWPDEKLYYLRAFNHLVGKAETLAYVVEHYIETRQWALAYMYSSFCYSHFIVHNHVDYSIQYRDDALYKWRILFLHYQATFGSGRKAEAKKLYKELRKKTDALTEFITTYDLINIRAASPALQPLKNLKEALRRRISNLFKATRINTSPTDKNPITDYASC